MMMMVANIVCESSRVEARQSSILWTVYYAQQASERTRIMGQYNFHFFFFFFIYFLSADWLAGWLTDWLAGCGRSKRNEGIIIFLHHHLLLLREEEAMDMMWWEMCSNVSQNGRQRSWSSNCQHIPRRPRPPTETTRCAKCTISELVLAARVVSCHVTNISPISDGKHQHLWQRASELSPPRGSCSGW